MKKHKAKEIIPVSYAVFFVVVGLILGTVFMFGMRHWGARIEREDSVSVAANFDSYRKIYGKHGRILEIKIMFTDYDPLYIDGACFDTEVISAIEALPEGANLNMLVHPNSDTIWELKQENNTILSFEKSQECIEGENIGFAILGIFAYLCAALGIGSLLVKWVRARKRKARKS